MLGQALKALKMMMAAALKENKIDLSFEQFVTLMFLSLEKRPIQQELANQLQKDKSVILRHINVLIERQYVIRVPDENDKRMKKLVLTTKGSETVVFLKLIKTQVENQLVSGIGKEELKTFIEVLNKIQANGEFDDELCPWNKWNEKQI